MDREKVIEALHCRGQDLMIDLPACDGCNYQIQLVNRMGCDYSGMKVLVACEESQAVCKAFRERGHEAYSADLQECSGGHPEWHIMGDVLPLINGDCQFVTEGGATRRDTREMGLDSSASSLHIPIKCRGK